MNLDIRNNESNSQFETTIDGHTAAVAYILEPGLITFTHTGVPEELGGRGIGGALAKHALEHARANNLEVVPSCSYIAGYIGKNPEYQDLVRRQ
jgi:predicted GNAT family acetyltransferase